MKIDKSLFFVSLLTLFFSCKKDDDFKQITYPSVYHKSGIKTAGDLRVFSSSGEIRDPSIISRFTETDTLYYSYAVDYLGNQAGRMDSIKFSDEQHAKVNDLYYNHDCSISQKDGSLILTGVDTSTGYAAGDQFTRTLIYYISEVKPEVYTEFMVSSTRGNYVFGYTGREKFILQESKGQLVAPEILFLSHQGFVYNPSSVNNILQQDFYKNLAAGDTVTVREYFILYEKQ